MASNEQKAAQLITEAEKKLNSGKSFFGSLFGGFVFFYFVSYIFSTLNLFTWYLRGSSKVEEAIELYQRAANLFKMDKKWSQAGQAFCKVANLHLETASRHDAATNYIDAGNCYKKSEPNGGFCLSSLYHSTTYKFYFSEAVNCLLKAIEIYTDMGRFSIAAKHHQTIAEIYESELADLDRAVQHYEQAADYFKG